MPIFQNFSDRHPFLCGKMTFFSRFLKYGWARFWTCGKQSAVCLSTFWSEKNGGIFSLSLQHIFLFFCRLNFSFPFKKEGEKCFYEIAKLLLHTLTVDSSTEWRIVGTSSTFPTLFLYGKLAFLRDVVRVFVSLRESRSQTGLDFVLVYLNSLLIIWCNIF